MSQPKADLGKRILAAIIDSLIGSIPALIPVIGGLVSTAYMLVKDAAVYELTKNEEFKNRSIGKKLMKIEVVPPGGEGHVDWAVSMRRNIPLAIASAIAIIPVIGWAIALVVGPILFLVELILVLTSPTGQRFGDKFAKTMVVNSAE